MSARIGLVGFGEAGSCLGTAVAASGARLAVHDIAFPDPERGAPLRDAVAAAGGSAVEGPWALDGSDLVLSLVTPADAVAAAEAFAASGAACGCYVDLNSTAPEQKRRIAQVLAGTEVVDGVLVGGGIRIDGARIPVRLAGPRADDVAERLGALGLVASCVGEEVGAAAALKMLRGVVIKGLEALYVEALLAAAELGVVEPLLDSLEETLDGSSAREYATMLVTTHVVHAPRRRVEAAMIRDTVAGTGRDPVMSEATSRRLARTAAALAVTGRSTREVPATIADALAVLTDLPDTLEPADPVGPAHQDEGDDAVHETTPASDDPTQASR